MPEALKHHLHIKIGHALLFCLIALLATWWGRYSRRVIVQEKQRLEDAFDARTREYEKSQLARTMELQRFATFGRVCAHLVHEVANPLTAASLNLEQVKQSRSRAVREAYASLQEMERYIEAARKQLRAQSYQTEIDSQQEVKQLLMLLLPIAKKAGVKLEVIHDCSKVLHGDPIKFNQIIANVVVNAIDAYKDYELDNPHLQKINISFKQQGTFLEVLVVDYGKGISPEHLPLIFTPLFSTKLDAVRGLGIGLSLVKQSIEEDFDGSVSVNSTPSKGTTFQLLFRLPPENTNVEDAAATHQLLAEVSSAVG